MSAPLPHEPVSFQWFSKFSSPGNVWPWSANTWNSRIVLGPLEPGESIRIELANGQTVIVRPKAVSR